MTPIRFWLGIRAFRYWRTFTKTKGRVFLTISDAASGESNQQELFRIEKVIDLDWSPDGRRIAFSGVRARQNRPLRLQHPLAGSQVPLWEDGWDDLNPDWTPDGRGLLFSSNRPGEGRPVDDQPSGPGEPPKGTCGSMTLDAPSHGADHRTPRRTMRVRPIGVGWRHHGHTTLAEEPEHHPHGQAGQRHLCGSTRPSTTGTSRARRRGFMSDGPVAELNLLEARDGWEAVAHRARPAPLGKTGDLPAAPTQGGHGRSRVRPRSLPTRSLGTTCPRTS